MQVSRLHPEPGSQMTDDIERSFHPLGYGPAKTRMVIVGWNNFVRVAAGDLSANISAGGPGMVSNRLMPWLSASFLAFLLLSGCADNPVTGERELALFSTEFEIETGQNHYGPAKQAGGGVYTADPELVQYVSSVGHRIAAVSDRNLPYEFVVLNNTIPNAWALPGGKIAINRGLLMEMENEAELAAVLSHEVVHAAARHGSQAMNRSLLYELGRLGVELGGVEGEWTGTLLGVGAVAFSLANQGYSREAEREADYHGMRYMHSAGYDTLAAVTLQEKFLGLSGSRDDGWLLGLFASHPPSAERVVNNRAALTQFPPGGEIGRERYDRRLAGLRAARAAYDAGDAARRLLAERPDQSLRRIDEAIAREPREPMFYDIRGQALARLGRFEEAIQAYSAAISRGAPYWEYYLGRGLAHDARGDLAQARSDLRRSVGLLPTGLGNLALGTLALEDGRTDEAKWFFQTAMEAEGPDGDVAEREYVLLDILDAPWKYVRSEPFFENGQIVVDVSNRTEYRLEGVVVRLDATVNGQRIQQWLPPRRLRSGGSVVLNGGVYYADDDEVEARTRVIHAEPVFERPFRWRPYEPYP